MKSSAAKKIIEKKQSTGGAIYGLQTSGARFNVVWQDAFSWKYVSGGKALDESTARNLFAALSL